MLSEQNPHYFIMLFIFLAWAKVLHPAEACYQSAGSFVHLPASVPLNLPAEHPSMSQNPPRCILLIFPTLCSS